MRFLDTSRIGTRFDEHVIASDGIELSVDLYLPERPGEYPILLNRTPADNNRSGRPGISSSPAERWKAFAAQGYIVAACDVRGRGDSGGAFVPFINEGVDGATTVAWLRALPECNGKVGAFGSGYAAFCAWAAIAAHARLDAIASISPFGAVGEGLCHRGGAVRLDWLFWMHLIGGRTVQPADVPPWKTIYRHWPLQAMDEALGRSDIWWQDWLEHLGRDDPYWNALNLADEIAASNVPGLHITGWWDGQNAGAHYYYDAAIRSSARQQLIIGPWDSAGARRPRPQIGGFDFGPRSLVDVDETIIEFFRTTLNVDRNDGGESLGPTGSVAVDAPGRVPAAPRLFFTGRNEWVSEPSWPAGSTEVLTLYLSSTLGANTRRGDGVLCKSVPLEPGSDSVIHNPLMPVDFQPQFASFAAVSNSLGFTLDQSHLTARDESLVYTSEALDKTITILGRARVAFTVRTPAPDADIFFLLSDNFPLGIRDLHLSHTVVRLATLGSFRPGEPVRVELEMDSAAHDFLPGHQIRLTMTPSLYPLYARNPQVDEYFRGRLPTVSGIELLYGPNDPALLILPLALPQ